jgi:O-antigen/teichoic acid export membrane protein
MPAMVALVGTRAEIATFYIAWQLTSLAFFAPFALAQALYTIGARDASRVGEQARITLGLAFVAGIATVAALSLFSHPLLGLFGHDYEAVSWVVPLLALAVFPMAIKDHYQIIQRIRGKTRLAARLLLLGTVAELAAGVCGLVLFGLRGLAFGWLGVLVVEAAFLGRTLAQIIRQTT